MTTDQTSDHRRQHVTTDLTTNEQMFGPPPSPFEGVGPNRFSDNRWDQTYWDDFARRSVRTPPYVYRRRRLAVLVIVAVVLMLGLAIANGTITNEAPPTNSPDLLDQPNGSSDGRFHTCGYITEDGVTEYLNVYAARCPVTDDEWHTVLSDTDTTEGR